MNDRQCIEAVLNEDGPRDGYRCTISSSLAKDLDKSPESHIRVKAGEQSCYYVIDAIHDDTEIDLTLSQDGFDRLGATSGDVGVVSATVPEESYRTAQFEGGLVETLRDTADSEVFISCPHGGDIEYGTDQMGVLLWKILSKADIPATAWMCHGFDSIPGSDVGHGDAFKRWHLEKPVRAIDAYPKLQQLEDRRFQYSVGFHMHVRDPNLIGVGGQADDELRREVANALRDELGSYVDVVWRYDAFPLTGRSDDSSINHFTESGQGIQLEMPPKVCYNKYRTVPQAVLGVLSNQL